VGRDASNSDDRPDGGHHRHVEQVTGVLKASGNLTGRDRPHRSRRGLVQDRHRHAGRGRGEPWRAGKYPVAVFTLEKIKSATLVALAPGAPVDIVAEGTFELKGVRKSITVPARITYVPKGGPFSKMRPGNFVRLTAQFDFKLEDYGVERNGPVLPLQVGDTAHVTVTVLASDASRRDEGLPRQRDQAWESPRITFPGKRRADDKITVTRTGKSTLGIATAIQTGDGCSVLHERQLFAHHRDPALQAALAFICGTSAETSASREGTERLWRWGILIPACSGTVLLLELHLARGLKKSTVNSRQFSPARPGFNPNSRSTLALERATAHMRSRRR
jgi:hypothetical protein